MKNAIAAFKIIIALLIVFTAKVSTATITVHHDNTNGYYYCNITPVVCQIGSDTSTRLEAITFGDNNINQCQIAFTLRSANGNSQCVKNLNLQGSDYVTYRQLCESTDTTLRIKFIYEYIHDQMPNINPL